MLAEMRGNYRGKFQRRMQKRFLHGLPFRRVICGLAVGAMKQHRAIGMRSVVVFRRENAAVGNDFAARECFLLDHHAESITRPRIGVKIQVPAEYCRQAHSQFRPLSRVQYGIEKRAVHLSDNADFLGFRRNGLHLGVKFVALRPDVQNAIGINAITHFAHLAQARAAHYKTVSRAQVAQIENRLRRCHQARGGVRAEPHALQESWKRLARRDHSLR